MCLSKNLSMNETHQGMSCVKDFCTKVGLRRVSVVTLQDAAEFALAADGALGLRDESLVQYRVVSSDTPVGSLLVIMFQPNSIDVVQLVKTETDEMIQHFLFHLPNIRFNERVVHREAGGIFGTGFSRPTDAGVIRILPPLASTGPAKEEPFVDDFSLGIM